MITLKELCCIIIKKNSIKVINFADLEDIYNNHLNYYCTYCLKYVGKIGLRNKNYHENTCKWNYNLFCYGCNKYIYCNNKAWVSTCVPNYCLMTGTYCDNIIGCSRHCADLQRYQYAYRPCFNCYKLSFYKTNCDCFCSDDCEIDFKIKNNKDKCNLCNKSLIYGFPYRVIIHIC